ncbi:inositol polyphosphate 1-phosphatase-like isoform X2 [Polyodon spathula]|uniref:inositol polyphosphate 1-phosphatase-like isoform X2 n=1 Tax=Polyodon spathula TaxID=7913 RepID=UPI001B7F250C|nr:inositol polyphosphate 1-phosphatase-like isoform X2 [Polyodon spathula]
MAGVLRALLSASEKAANIARVCRQEGALFQLLIQEKTGADKNKKFTQDFKTLADVIIQEFPELLHAIHGEESNTFENRLGGRVEVQVCSVETDTAALLCSVLDGNEEAAGLLAQTIHQEIELRDPAAERLELAIPTSSMGIWIDPIDSTNQYIKGRGDVDPEKGLYPSGLQSALVLIGVYDRASGEPIMGVINQPFNQCDPGSLRYSGTPSPTNCTVCSEH